MPAKTFSFDLADHIRSVNSALIVRAKPTRIDYQDRIDLKNNQLPEKLRLSSVNVYAIWSKSPDQLKWDLRYIGQRTTRKCWERVEQHLFHKPDRTESKLALVRAEVEAGKDIGITAVSIDPDSMRLALEVELIRLNAENLPWNIKSKASALS